MSASGSPGEYSEKMTAPEKLESPEPVLYGTSSRSYRATRVEMSPVSTKRTCGVRGCVVGEMGVRGGDSRW